MKRKAIIVAACLASAVAVTGCQQTNAGITITNEIKIAEKPAGGDAKGNPFAAGTAGCDNFRIPSLVALTDGTLVAATDARWDGDSDAYGLDTITAVSSDNGENWKYSFANYFGDNGNSLNKESTAFIDSAMTVKNIDGQDNIFMLVDLYPAGGSIAALEKGTGFDDKGRLLLHEKETTEYGYYLDGDSIYSTDGKKVEGLTVDEFYNISDSKGNSTNLFFADSPYKPLMTSYLYLTKSSDGGKTWSAPDMINAQVKSGDESFLGCGPGRGTVTSSGRIMFCCYNYMNGADGNSSVIYSDDNGDSWNRSESVKDQTSEATVTEADGKLYMFTRHGGYYISSDDGETWGSKLKPENIKYNNACQINAITYSQKIDGKTAIILSAPGSPFSRLDGTIYVGLIQEDNSIKWAYQYKISDNKMAYYGYSCIAELSNGAIGLLYESDKSKEQYITIPIEDITAMKNTVK